MVNQTRLKILTITTEFSEWYDVIITPSRERERERERERDRHGEGEGEKERERELTGGGVSLSSCWT